MKFPDDIEKILARRYRNKQKDWLSGLIEEQWPLEISLGIPTEESAIQQPEGVRLWISAWKSCQNQDNVIWCYRYWKILGTQYLPERLCLQTPSDVAKWLGELKAWQKANTRYQIFLERYPHLTSQLASFFDIFANYSDPDFQRLFQTVEWINKNPKSNLYLRQLPIMGLDSKWIEHRKKIVLDLMNLIQSNISKTHDFFQACGLKSLSHLIRLRILDPKLRDQIRGLCDITIPNEEFIAPPFQY